MDKKELIEYLESFLEIEDWETLWGAIKGLLEELKE